MVAASVLADFGLTPEQMSVVELLEAQGQGHLFEGWHKDGDVAGFFAQIKARKLLAASAKGENPLEGWTPEVPTGERLDYGSEAWLASEALGLAEVKNCAFVLVAGGLGERLGYSRIKVELPTETVTKTAYLRYYVETILALQKRSGAWPLPLAIMVSEDTEAMTVELLKANDHFGAARGQITLVKQGKVPALVDNAARIARDGPYRVQGKPHGHGDVHVLLHSSGLVKRWAQRGYKWVYFFQDTNGLGFRPLLPMLGLSAQKRMHCNFLTVPRVPQQAVGGIVKLTRKTTGEAMTLNVEYNQLDPLLRATVSPEGDVAGPDGFSPYPGNINQFVLACQPYSAVLERTEGVMAEFVNPKYADAAKTTFKKPARLECMMQDYPKVLPASEVVGFTSAPAWLAFSPCKNNTADAAKAKPPACAMSAEADQYFHCAEMLRTVGVNCAENDVQEMWDNISSTKLSPAVVLAPAFAQSSAELKARFPAPAFVTISKTSTLVLDGDVTVRSLHLDGCLVIKATHPGTKVTVLECVCKNAGVTRLNTSDEAPEALKIRGYDSVFASDAAVFDKIPPGKWVITTVDGTVQLTPESPECSIS